eukprot:1534482-Pyramimonas_sp.AAC.1
MVWCAQPALSHFLSRAPQKTPAACSSFHALAMSLLALPRSLRMEQMRAIGLTPEPSGLPRKTMSVGHLAESWGSAFHIIIRSTSLSMKSSSRRSNERGFTQSTPEPTWCEKERQAARTRSKVGLSSNS